MENLAKEIVEAFEAIDKRRAQEAEEQENKDFEDSVEFVYEEAVQEYKTELKEQARRSAEYSALRMRRCVSGYFGRAYGKMIDEILASGKAPLVLNFKVYYKKLQKVESGSVFVNSIEQILDRERQAIMRIDSLNLTDAYHEGSAQLVDILERLQDIKVVGPDAIEESILNDDDKAYLDSQYESVKSEEENLTRMIDDILDTAFEGLANPDDSLKASLEDAEGRIVTIDETAEKTQGQLEAILNDRARKAQGQSLDLSDLKPFTGRIEFVGDADSQDGAEESKGVGVRSRKLLQLLYELQKSFETYRQVVRDQGIFAAFPGSVSCSVYFGKVGFSGHGADLAAPEEIEQDAGGDSIERAIERMKAFNSVKYFGILDDGYQEHVNAFWYGFAKLAEFIDVFSEVDLKSFYAYKSRLYTALISRAYILGLYMNNHQLADYEERIAILEKEVFER